MCSSEKRTARRLVHYLGARKKTLEILEVGCGNGWLTHQLADIPGTRVTGLDINFTELQQAARVFSNDPNLRFIHGDMRSGIWKAAASTTSFLPQRSNISPP